MAEMPPTVIQLIGTFEQHVDTYRSSQYNETQLPREFVDPLFDALGYKLYNLSDEEIKIVEGAGT